MDISPVIFSVGPLEVRWYGLMYVIGFIIAGQLFNILSKEGFLRLNKKQIDNYIAYYLIIGMFLGARIAYVFIYNWDYYSQHMDEILAVWKGGLSFHGAVAGLCLGTWIFARKHKLHFLEVTDSLAAAGTQGLFFGRMGNFINGELYGRVTDSPFGMVFKNGGPYPRHPSQLYEGILEGIILFLILWFMRKKVKIHGMISTVFMVGYGAFRYFVEFFREADAQLGYYFGGTTTMGQILCFIMILLGGFVFWYAKRLNLTVQRRPA
jgi:phosphatidylglycerol:prolipoprotein diacylglycerol transferase